MIQSISIGDLQARFFDSKKYSLGTIVRKMSEAVTILEELKPYGDEVVDSINFLETRINEYELRLNNTFG